MSATTILERRDGLHFITDGASYLPTGELVAVKSKVHILPQLPAIISSRGSAWAGPIMEFEFARRYRDFDALVGDIETDLPEIYARYDTLFAGSGHPELELYLGGWSDRRKRFAAYRITSFDQAIAADKEDVAPELAVEVARPFKLTEIETKSGFVTPNLSAEDFQRGFGPSLGAVGSSMEIDVVARIILELQRERKIAISEGAAAAHYVGGFAQVTTLRGRDAISSSIVHRWPDQIGRHIEPAAVDWKALRNARRRAG